MEQSWTNVEIIVIDGGSTDQTVARLQPFRQQLAHFSSERDEGLYDAMNKGLSVATGDYVCFMNAGDQFHHPRALERVANQIESSPKLLFGRAVVSSDVGEHTNPPLEANIDEWMGSGFPSHQASFYPAEFARQNRYRLDIGSVADTDYTLRAIQLFGWRFIDDITCDFALGGISNRFASWREVKTLTAGRMSIVKMHRKAFNFAFLLKYLSGPSLGWIIKSTFGVTSLTKLRHISTNNVSDFHKAVK